MQQILVPVLRFYYDDLPYSRQSGVGTALMAVMILFNSTAVAAASAGPAAAVAARFMLPIFLPYNSKT